MKIKATDKQVREMMAKACNASTPMGLGFLHYDDTTVFTAEDFDEELTHQYLDYVQGRMVKFNMRQVSPDVWECADQISNDYQSWKRAYPSYAVLAKACGASVVE